MVWMREEDRAIEKTSRRRNCWHWTREPAQ
jgi:hypothetical protein